MMEDDRKSDLVEELATVVVVFGSTVRGRLNSDRSLHLAAGELNVEMQTTNPLLPTDRMWAIRLNSCGIVTIVLGIRDYGRGWYSTHFASLAATRLGLPLRRIRLYYSGTLPAVLQTPQGSGALPAGSQPGPLAAAVGTVIEEMCGRVVEKALAIFAELAGATTATVGFDQSAGRFFALDGGWSASILDLAQLADESGTPLDACSVTPTAT